MPTIDPDAFKNIDAQIHRSNQLQAADPGNQVAAANEAGLRSMHQCLLCTGFVLSQVYILYRFNAVPAQHKAVLKRFIDSLLTKITKLRTLIRDLKKNYPTDRKRNSLA